MRAARAAVAEDAVATPLGTLLRHDGLPRISSVNGLIVHGVEDPAAAGDLVGMAQELSRTHVEPRVTVEEGPLAAALTPRLAAAGWTVERHVVMVLAPGAEAPAEAARAAEVPRAEARAIEQAVESSMPYGADAALVAQILAFNDAVCARTAGRCFAAERASTCWLLSDGDLGQVEEVVTLPAARGRGLARAAVGAAIEAAAGAGLRLTFIVADADDWPRAFYARLGFETVGTLVHCTHGA